MGKRISVILPCLNEEKNIPPLVDEIIKNIPKKFDYEIIGVDDGSDDKTAEVWTKLARNNQKIKVIIFHRRFGHQAALLAGIREAKGEAVVTMDADFQHPPKIIPKMIEKWEAGHDLVNAKKKEDKHQGIALKIERKVGYAIWKYISDGMIVPGVSNFRLVDKKIVTYLKESQESDVFFRGVTSLAAKNPTQIEYKVGIRKYGKSGYHWGALANMFLNGFVSFSIKPLRMAFLVGIAVILFSGGYLIYDIAQAIYQQRPIIEGYKTTVILISILNGFIICYLGILGEYIGIILKETKKRPGYIIDKKINL